MVKRPENNFQKQGRKLFDWFKRKYPGCILFFRMDDNYKCFFEDVKICSKVLGLIPTIRNRGNNLFSFLSIPAISIENSIQKIITVNHKIAVFEEVETRNCMMDITRRGIVRIVTPSDYT